MCVLSKSSREGIRLRNEQNGERVMISRRRASYERIHFVVKTPAIEDDGREVVEEEEGKGINGFTAAVYRA